jgi:hypothetical protein
MRKDREQQKKEGLNSSKTLGQPAELPEGRTGGKAASGAELSSQLERQRTLTVKCVGEITSTHCKVEVNRNRLGTTDVCRVVWGDSGATRFLPN